MTDELTWMPASEIRALIAKGDVSPVEVTDHFLGRIEDLDPKLHAFRSLDAAGERDQAKRAEDAVRSGDELGSLHGIPVSVKEHLAVAGHPLMGAGFPEPISTRDALGVQRLPRCRGDRVRDQHDDVHERSPPGQRRPDGHGFRLGSGSPEPVGHDARAGLVELGGAAATVAGLIPLHDRHRRRRLDPPPGRVLRCVRPAPDDDADPLGRLRDAPGVADDDVDGPPDPSRRRRRDRVAGDGRPRRARLHVHPE